MENSTFKTPNVDYTKRKLLVRELNESQSESLKPIKSKKIEEDNILSPVSQSKRLKSDKGVLTPFKIPPSPCMKRLGYGTGINVYLIERFSPDKGSYKSPWAVKKINRKVKQNPEYKSRLEVEAKILKNLSHPNIIGYRSEARSEDGSLCLVMESGQRSLADLIEVRLNDELGPFPASKILKVAHSLAAGLHYLHEECHILHGDLKSANVLIKGDFEVVKLCDFGVCLSLNDKLTVEDTTQYYIGTECWSAPEVLNGDEVISNKTDMFSYALVLWEMLSLCPPHTENGFDSSLFDDSSEEVIAAIEENYQNSLGTRPPLPDVSLDESYNQVIEIFCICTLKNPCDRPSAEQILKFYFPNQEVSER